MKGSANQFVKNAKKSLENKCRKDNLTKIIE